MKLARLTLALAIAFSAGSGAVRGQQYPSKPIRMVVPYPAGGGSDLLSRPVAQRLSEKFGQSVVVDNRGGATGMIGTDIAAKSSADGYTLLLGSVAEVALNLAVYSKMPYNPERDLAAVSLIAISPLVLAVHPSLPARRSSSLSRRSDPAKSVTHRRVQVHRIILPANGRSCLRRST